MMPTEFRERALALQAWLDAVAADVPWPPHLQAMIDRCRDDLALALASTDPETICSRTETRPAFRMDRSTAD